MRFALLLLAACTPETEPPVDPGPTSIIDTSTPTTTDTGFEVGTFAFAAQFGYDADADELVAVSIDGQLVEPAIEIYLGQPGWNADPNLDSMFCTVTVSLAGATAAQWATDDPLYWRGFDTTGPGETDCPELDPYMFGDDVVATFASLDLGVAIGPRSTDLDDWLLPQIGTGDAGLYYGGLLKVTDVVGQDVELAYGTAYEVDSVFALQFDGSSPVAVPTSTLEAPGTGTAWYVVNSATYFTL